MKRPLLLAAWLLLPLAVVAASGKVIVYLRFAPQEPINSDPPKMEHANLSRAIRMGEIVDKRAAPDPQMIGQNTDSRGQPIVRAAGSVPDFVSSSLTTCLTTWGIRFSDAADVTLKGEIATLMVQEANRYNAEINIRFRLENSEGVSLWEGVATGHASTWGASMSAANYNQVLSDAMRLLSADLAGNASFQTAWAGQVPANSAPVVSRAELRAKILELMKNGVSVDVIAGYVRSRRLAQPLTADEILAWRKDGVPDDVIKAALPESKPRE